MKYIAITGADGVGKTTYGLDLISKNKNSRFIECSDILVRILTEIGFDCSRKNLKTRNRMEELGNILRQEYGPDALFSNWWDVDPSVDLVVICGLRMKEEIEFCKRNGWDVHTVTDSGIEINA